MYNKNRTPELSDKFSTTGQPPVLHLSKRDKRPRIVPRAQRVRLTDEVAKTSARDYLTEIGWFGEESLAADFVF